MSDAQTLTQVQTYKGWFYVLVTAGFLYALIKQSLHRQTQIEKSRLDDARRFSALIENAHDVIYTVDLNGNFKSINKAGEKLLGYSREEFLRLNLTDIVSEKDFEFIKLIFVDPHVIESFPSTEISLRCKNGQNVVLEVKNRLVKENETGVLMQGIGRDVTQRRADDLQLKEREAQLRELVATANEGIWTIDETGKITFVNKKLADMLGYEINEMLGTSFLDYMDDEAKIQAERNLNRRRSGISEQIDFQLKKRDGSTLWVIASTNPIFRDGVFVGALAMMNDITDRRRSELEKAELADELERQRSYLKYIVSSVPGIVWETHFKHDEQSNDIVFVSEYVEKMLGYSVSEWLETPNFWMKIIHPEDRARVEKESHEIFADKEVENSVQNYRWIKKDGSAIWVETRMRIERDFEGRAISSRGVTVDVTEQHEAEDRLRLSEERFRSMVNAVAQIVWIADSAGNIHTARDSAGNRIEKLVGDVKEFWAKQIHPDDRERVLRRFEQSVKDGVNYTDEYRIFNPNDNQYHHYISRGVPIYEKGAVREWVGTLTDVTKEVVAENALRESEDRLNTVINNLNEGLVSTDLEGKSLLWNRAALEMHDFVSEKDQHRPLKDFAESYELETLDGRVLDFEEWVLPRVARGETIKNEELIVRHKASGAERVFSYNGARVKESSGREIAFVSISDVTDKKRAEAALKKLNEELEQRIIERTKEVRDSEERLRLVGENGTDGYWDLNLLTGEEYLSPNFKETFGYTDEELPNYVNSWRSIVFPEDLERADEALRAHLEEGKPYNLQVRYHHKNGSTVWINCRGVALKNEKGEHVRMVGTHINITQQKLAEEALYKLNTQLEQRVLEKTKEVRQSEAFFRQLSEGLPLLVWTCRGEDSSCDYLSPQWVAYTGIPEHEQLDFKWLDQIHPDDREYTINEWLAQTATGTPVVMEFRIRRYDGVYRWFKTLALPLKDIGGSVVKWFGTNVDIDDLKFNEQTMSLLQNLSVKVSKAENLEVALEDVLIELRALTDWEAGEIWLPDQNGEFLYMARSSCIKDDEIKTFCENSREVHFRRGEGLPGTVWETKKHFWIKNVSAEEKFVRKESAAAAGIKTGVFMPVLTQETVVAVMAFFSVKDEPDDERSTKVMMTVASQIGEFLQRKRAENDLKQSEARLQLGIGVSKMAIVEIDMKTGLLAASPEAYELFGFAPEKQITCDDLMRVIHPEDRETVTDLIGKAHDPNETAVFEVQHRIVRTDGKVRSVNVKQQMFFAADKEGNNIPIKAVLVFLDNTKTKRMEEDLRVSEERLKMLHGIVSDFHLDYKEKINEILKLGAQIFGMENGLVGQVKDGTYHLEQVVSPGGAFCSGYTCNICEAPCEETMRLKQPFFAPDLGDSIWKDDAVFKTYRMKSYFGTTIENNNRVYGTLCFLSANNERNPFSSADTEFLKLMAQWVSAELTRNKAEEDLRESEERFRILFEESPSGKVIIDLESNRFVECNTIATEILGYAKEEITTLRVEDLDIGKTPEEWSLIIATVKNGGKIQYETVSRTKSGDLRNLLFVSTGVTVEGKKYSYSSFLDITEMKRVEATLSRERERFEKIAAVSPGVIHSYHLTQDDFPSFPYSSPAIYEFYAATPEELKQNGTIAHAIVHADDSDRLWDSILKSRDTLQSWNEIWRVNHPEKGTIWIEGHSSPVREADGTTTWHGVLTDVTERTRHANELAERERLITAIFNTAPSLIVLWDMKTGKILFANEASIQVVGFEPDDILKFSKTELFKRIHEEDLPGVREFIEQLLQARDGEVLSHEYRYRHPSGDWRILQSQDTVFERDEHGSVVKTLNIIDDITNRKMAEKALYEAEERFVKAFEASPAAVAFTRLSDGVIIDVNKSYEQILGFSADELIGRRGIDLSVLPEELSETEFLELLAHVSTAKNMEMTLRTKQGETVYALVSNEIIEIRGEACMLSIIYDITDRKRAEEELRKTEEKLIQAQKLESVGRLAGGIAHDFNNMLTAINGYSDLTLRQIGEKNPLRHNLEEIRKAGQRSAELTQQLLAFSRKQVLKPEITNVNSIINDTIGLLKRLIGEDVILETCLEPGIDLVRVDPARLSQVIVNLAVNSRDAMPKGGILTIETRNIVLDEHYAEAVIGAKAGEYVLLTVSDTGTGMTEEEKEHIFEPFYTTKEVGKGTGLGLATVYGFVKQSEGSIWVYSEPGHGTSFKIYLPAIKENVLKTMEHNNVELQTGGSETILLVEDEELVRNLNREILESNGYKVIEATNGVEALKICEDSEIKIDLLMTDVVMPEMGGSELASKLAISHPHLKVLFTSGYTDDAVVRHGVIDEGTNFLQKPFSLDTLLRKLRAVLDDIKS